MKIVKMHKGTREAFDDFLEQRLNELEIDNDMADKYFTAMNLPVPVILAPTTTFFSKNKNKLWSLVLLFCISTITFLFVKNSKNNIKVTVGKESNFGNNTTNINTNTNKKDVATSTISNPIVELKNKSNINTLEDNKILDDKIENKTKNYLKTNASISNANLNASKNIYLAEKKTNILASKNLESNNLNNNNLFKNDSIEVNANVNLKNVDDKTSNKLQNSNAVKNQKVAPIENKSKADSLYIVW